MKTYRCVSRASLPLLLLPALFAGSCSHPGFTVKGEIEGADNQSVILEKADFVGQWIALDSVRTDSKGAFTLHYAAPDTPEIYRLRVGDAFAYIPVDSAETVTLTAVMKDFPNSWSLKGSPRAKALSDFEADYRKAGPHMGIPDSVRSFKRRVFSKYLHNTGASVVSYYILTKTTGDDKPLFDPNDREDLKIFSAVATDFKEHRPDDPRTPLLENTVITARRAANSNEGRKLVVEAEEMGLIPIALPDENGRVVSLSEVTGKGKPTVLMFGVMVSESAVRANHALADLIRRRGGDLNVYSVSFDSDAGRWSESARNVPWTTVLDHNSTSSVATDYNLSVLPVFYIIDRQGNLVDRTEDINQIDRLVSKHS